MRRGDDRHTGPQAQRLLDRRRRGRRRSSASAASRQALERAGRRTQPLEAPTRARGGRLVPGDEQRHELVAQLAVGHRLAVLVARGEQHREDVVALARPVARGARAICVEHQRVGAVARPRRSAARRSAGRALRRSSGSSVSGDALRSSSRVSAVAQLVELRPVGDAEHGAQDHLERDRLHARVQRERLAGGQPAISARGDLAPSRRVARACARRGTAAASACAGEVLGAVEQQHRARADARARARARPRRGAGRRRARRTSRGSRRAA